MPPWKKWETGGVGGIAWTQLLCHNKGGYNNRCRRANRTPHRYHKLLLDLKEMNETFFFLLLIPLTPESTIVYPEKSRTRTSVLMRHFTQILRIREKTRSVWAAARLGFNGKFEMMINHKDYNLSAANILLMKKNLQLPFTKIIYIL